MGWVAIIVLVLALLAALWRLAGIKGAALQFVASAVLIAMAGYAWQGRPGLEGKPMRAPEKVRIADSPFASLRGELLGRFDRSSQWLTLAEGYQRRGDTMGGAQIIESGIRAHPGDMGLWIGLGNALVLHAGGLITPAAEFAFERAQALAPAHPGPRFFYGLSLAQSGRIADTERVWRELLADAPAGAKWRRLVEERLRVIDEARAAGRIP